MCVVCAGAAAWLVSGPLTTLSLSLFNRERFHRRLLVKPFTVVTENFQKQEAGQAGAAWPRAPESLPGLRKAARSSCAVIWSHAWANLHFQRWNRTAKPLFSSLVQRKKAGTWRQVLYHRGSCLSPAGCPGSLTANQQNRLPTVPEPLNGWLGELVPAGNATRGDEGGGAFWARFT